MKRPIVLTVLAVNFLEWLEFSLYLYMAKSVFAREFFPSSSHSLMLTFAVFAAGYLARPLGGWVFGRAADLNGRRKPMMLTAGLMGMAMLGICLLPGYALIGAVATWLLLLFRLLQGLALGGEINTSAIYMIEHHNKNPMLAGSLVATFGALGMFFGGVLAALIQYSDVGWLWRVVFAAVGCISLWVSSLRKQLSESPEFDGRQNLTVKALWQRHWQGMVNIAAVGAFVSVTVYICNIFWLAFAAQLQMWPNVLCVWIAAFAQLGSALIAIPIARAAEPRQGQQLLQLSMLTIAISAPLLFYFTLHKLSFGIWLGLSGYVVGNGLLCASFYYFLYQQLPTQYRCRGTSIIWALAASIGALALPIAQQAVAASHLYWVPGVIVSGVSLSALVIIRQRTYQPSKIKDVRLA